MMKIRSELGEGLVPEEPNEGSQAIYCLEYRKGYPSRRDGLISLSPALDCLRPDQALSRLNHTVPLGRVAIFLCVPGSKLPG
jgi:hypothetical protein